MLVRRRSGDGATVTINGGEVTATSGGAAQGIGAGYYGASAGTVTFGKEKPFLLKAGNDATSAVFVPQAQYVTDHSAVYAQIEAKDVVALLKVSAGVGYRCIVTNTTAMLEVCGTYVNGTNCYAFATNDSYSVFYSLGDGYEWVTEPTENPMTGTITEDTTLPEVVAKACVYYVTYDANGAAGTMEYDTFKVFETTNLTANAFSAVGYSFAGWTTNGVDVAYADQAAGVDFAQPGETLALSALWTQVETKPTSYADLTNMIAQATLPVTFTLDENIVLQPGDKVVIPEGKDITFAGTGKFDVSVTIPTLWNGVAVGEGFANDSALALFKTDKDAKAYFEDGKVWDDALPICHPQLWGRYQKVCHRPSPTAYALVD